MGSAFAAAVAAAGVAVAGVGVGAGCGRIGFTARADGDASGASGEGGGDASTVTRWTHITAYTNATCGLRTNTVYCWGDNSAGQLGTSAAGGSSKRPIAVALPAGTIRDLSLGDNAACAIVDTDLYCWGSQGTPAPAKIVLAAPATDVSVGHSFQCAIAGGALCWGINPVGQLGTGDTTTQTVPTAVKQGMSFVSIETGDDHACAMDASNVPWCWGHNDLGAIALAQTTDHSTTPVGQPAGIDTLPQIAGWHTCAMAAGSVRCWGEGDHGELGDGGSSNSSTAVTVTGLTAPTLVATGGGPTDDDASCAIDATGVRCWGNGFYGRLGQGTANPSTTPVAVVGLPAAKPTEVTIGDDHACAALADGSLWCWGRGDLGQLGDGLGASSLTPVRVLDP